MDPKLSDDKGTLPGPQVHSFRKAQEHTRKQTKPDPQEAKSTHQEKQAALQNSQKPKMLKYGLAERKISWKFRIFYTVQ